ncbi:MAG: DUF2878 domain-containing protein [Candidatus Omnitrophica bacterium]|nr:DUF2878 domain-containing protein [Candidatus Omnitrophota bacterium]
MSEKLINFVLFQAGWFICVISAAAGRPWLGPVFVAVWVIAFARWQGKDPKMAWVRMSALGLGYLFDSALVMLGFFSFPTQTQLGGPAPIWMAFMWVNLAGTLDSCLEWLSGRYLLGGLLGLIGGPLAYWGGENLGGIQLSDPLWRSLTAVGIEWAIAFPILLWLNEKVRSMKIPSTITPQSAGKPEERSFKE